MMPKIALQTFTIRHHIQKEADIDTTFKKLSEAGIKYLELARVDFNLNAIHLIKKYLEKYQLTVISTQIKLSTILKHYDEIVEIHHLLNTSIMAISVIPFRSLYLGRKRLVKFVHVLNQLGQKLKDDHINLLFHHHNYEFIKYNKKLALDIIIKYMNPKFVNLLTDTYWINKGGFKVIEFLEKYQKVIKGIHLRGQKNKRDINLLESDFDFIEIIQFMIQNEIIYGAIEQNTIHPFIEINKSINHIKSLGFTNLLGGTHV